MAHIKISLRSFSTLKTHLNGRPWPMPSASSWVFHLLSGFTPSWVWPLRSYSSEPGGSPFRSLDKHPLVDRSFLCHGYMDRDVGDGILDRLANPQRDFSIGNGPGIYEFEFLGAYHFPMGLLLSFLTGSLILCTLLSVVAYPLSLKWIKFYRLKRGKQVGGSESTVPEQEV